MSEQAAEMIDHTLFTEAGFTTQPGFTEQTLGLLFIIKTAR